jgi:putative ABC transport system permease protein
MNAARDPIPEIREGGGDDNIWPPGNVIPLMHDALRDLLYALRAIHRMRGVAVVAILTLALGVGATTTMFSVVYATVLRTLPFADPDGLLVLFNTSNTPREGLVRMRWSMPNILTLRASTASFEAVASFSAALVSTSGNGDPEYIDAEVVSADYFRVLRATPVSGRTFRHEEDTITGAQAVTMISWRLWNRKLGGDASSVGRTIVINDVPLTIVGILPEGFAGLTGKAELWIPPPMAARLTYSEYLTTPQNFISVIARLKAGTTVAQADAELAAIGSRFVGNERTPDTSWSATSVPLRDARVDPLLRRSALALLVAAGCVLLIACVNVASLLLARARARRREVAVRLALGSGRRRLVRQLLTEGFLMALGAGILGTVVASWGVDLFARAAPAVVPSSRNYYAAIGTFGTPAVEPVVLTFALVIALGTTLLFALAPALTASRVDLVTALKEDERGAGRRTRSLSTLVVVEVAIASLLLAASGLLIENFARIQSRRTGFIPENVLTFWVRPPVSRYPVTSGPATVDRLLKAVQAAPGVESAAVNRCTPFSGCSRTILLVPGASLDPTTAPGVGRHYVSADYFRVLGIPLLAGRALSAGDRDGTPPVAVVNQAGARRFWPNESPIGKRVWFGTTTGPFFDRAHPVEIVGVVGDVKYEGVDQPDRLDRADFYTSYLQFSYPDTMLIVKARGPATALLPTMRNAVASVDPSLPIYDAMSLDERIGTAIARPRFNMTLLAAFTSASLLLAAIGVYGMLSYSVSSRIRDIGVRLALGADPGRVMRLVLGQGLRLAALGATIGFIASVAAGRVVRNLLPDAPDWNPRLIIAAAVVMLGVAGVASFLPARRASTVDPNVVLRNE